MQKVTATQLHWIMSLVGGVGWGKRGHEKGGGMVDYSFILSMH